MIRMFRMEYQQIIIFIEDTLFTNMISSILYYYMVKKNQTETQRPQNKAIAAHVLINNLIKFYLTNKQTRNTPSRTTLRAHTVLQ